MIGKIIADFSGLTEKWGGEKNGGFDEIKQIKTNIGVNRTEWEKFKQEVKAADGDEIKIKAAIDDSELKQLKNLDGLYDYAVNQSSAGKDVDLGSVNNLIQTQNYKNIADQAHGILGVNKAIDAYNESLIKNEDGTTKASDGTKKLNSAISQSNSSFGNYLTGLEGATAGIFNYGKSLATATLKTFALETATMALNTVVSFGASIIISGIITAITNYANSVNDAIDASHKAKETIDEANSTLKTQQNLIQESGRKYAELAQHVNQFNNTNLDLKEEEYEKFLDLSNQIAEQFPDLIKGYDDNGNAILNLDGTISDINSTLDIYIDKAKEASQIKIVQSFKGEGDNEDYFKGAKYEIDELDDKADTAKTEIENLQKLKGIIASDSSDLPDLFNNYSKGTDSHLKADYIRKYLNDSGFDKKLNEKSLFSGSLGNLSQEEMISFHKAVNDYNIDGQLSDHAILILNEILSKHSQESGYSISDYITQQIKVATDDYNQFADDVETKNKEIAQNAQAVLEQSVIWSDPDATDQMRTTMTNALSKIDWSDEQFEGFDGEQAANYIQTTFASSFEKLSDNDKITVDKFFNVDPNKTDITQYINLYENIKAIFEKQGINIPISIKDVKNVENDFNKSLEQMSDKDKETVKKYLADNSIDSVSELDVWNRRTEGITDATEAIQAYEKKAQEVSENHSTDKPLSFSKVWSKLKESDQNALKNETLEGVLDKDSISEFQDLSDNFSLQQIRDEILSLIPLDDKLSQFIDDSEKLTAAYSEMKKNKTVSTKTLLGMPEGIRRLDGYTDFRNTVADPKTSKESKKDAFEDIITEYLKANQTIMDSSEETRNFVVDALKDAGIINAETLVDGVINCKDTITEVMSEIDKANDTDVKNFARACSAKNLNNTKLYNSIGKNTAYMLNQLKDKYADDVMNFGKALQEKLKAEKKYAAAILEMEGIANGGTSNAAMASFFGTSGGAMSPSSDPEAYKKYKDAKQRLDKANKDYKKLLAKLKKDLKKVNIAEIDYSPSTKDSSSSKNKSSTKKTKTEIDWLSRRLTRMQSIIDLTAAKLQNLFSVKTKNSNLNRQIKQTNTLMKQYGIAADKYQKKADSVAKGYTTKIKSGKNKGKKKKVKPLSKDIINKIQSGKITKSSYSKLIKKYGQSDADRINKYIDYYDKAQDARKNKQDAKAKVRGLKQEKLQNYVDLYDSRTARAEAKESIQTNAKDKNEAIDTQIKNINKSYEKQKTIAEKISKDKAERDRLEYERQQKVKELQEQKLQNYVDEYNASADLASINSSNAIGYEKQNGFINEQLSWLQKSYEKQIEIAKLNGDITEEKRLQAEYDAKEVELKQEQIDNLKTDYENRIGLINNDKQDISNSLSETEARGDIVQAAFYSSLNSYEKQVLAKLNEERGKLLAQQNTFALYSPKWYDLQSDIQSVENEISSTNTSIIENSKKIGELKKTMYDDIASRNSDASSEAQFLAGLLGDALTDDKTGRLTKEGLGVLGTYGIELEANANTAGVFRQEREEIEKAIAAFHSGDPHALDMYGSLTAAKKELNEIIKKQQDAASSEYNAKKKIYDIMKQMYDAQLAYMSSIINAKTQVLDMEKDLYDYERNINSQTKNIASMEKQLASLKGDDSEEGRARRAKLQSALDEANQNLQDTEYERYISDQQNMLDNMYTQYEDLLTALEKDFETVVKDGITTINKTAGGISQTLNDIAEKYDYVTSKDMSSIMNSFKDTGLTKLESIFGSLANEIRNAYNNGTGGSNGGNGLSGQRGGNTDTNPPGGTPNRDTVIQQGKIDAENAETQKNDLKKILAKADYAKKAAKSPEKYKSRLNQILAKETGYVVTINDGYTASKFLQALNGNGNGSAKPGKDGSYYAKDGNIYKKLQEKFPLIGFRTGGIVRAGGVPKDGDHVPVRVNPDETILTKEFTEMLPETVETMKGLSSAGVNENTIPSFVGNYEIPNDKIQEIQAFINRTDQTRNIQPKNMGNNFGDIVVNANLPNVKDGHSFVSEVQNEIRSQRFFETCVHDCVTKGRITHNIQRF